MPAKSFTPYSILVLLDKIILAALIACTLSLSPAAGEIGEPRLVRPGDATSGALLLRSSEPGYYIEAPRLATDVEIAVSGPMARTTLTQRFENVTDQWVEGVYVFPLPDEAAVDTLKMQIGDRFIEGKIEEREKAKAIYERAKAEGRKASLVEQERPNIFTNAVANIGPGETIIVQIEYQETVTLADGRFSLRFPMVVAPRFNPPAVVHQANFIGDGVTAAGWGGIDPVPDRDRITPPVRHPDLGRINPVTLRVNINAGFPLGAVETPFHQMAEERRSTEGVVLTLADKTVPADRDFELIWSPKGEAPTAALFKETIKGTPYYLLMVTPPSNAAAPEAGPREVTFVIDTSGSMAGESIRQAKASLLHAIDRLTPKDTFNIFAFNSNMTALFTGPRGADVGSITRAKLFVRGLNARGGTQMLPALKAALAEHNGAPGRLRQVIFLTDGAIGNERELFDTIVRNRGDARIFTVGIGSAPNSYFMSRAAELGQGAFTHIGQTAQVTERMNALIEKLERPAITDLQVEWPAGVTAESWPSPIPDVYVGETLVIAAKAEATDGQVWVSGAEDGAPWRVALPIARAADRKGVSKQWARKKIAALELAHSSPGADHETLSGAILNVALDHQLVSRLTSLVAVDITPSRPQDDSLTTISMPTNLPKGWDFDKVFGEPAPEPLREAMAAPLISRLAAIDTSASPASSNGAAPVAPLPQTAAGVSALFTRGVILLVIAGFLLTFSRHPSLLVQTVGGGRG